MERVLEPEYMDTTTEAESYDAMDHGGPNRAFVERVIALSAKGKMLDIGTGPGHIPILLLETLGAADTTSTVVALDAAATMLDIARAKIAKAGLADRITVAKGDAKGLPFPDGTFDAVFSNTILHHIPDPRPFLREAVRVLKSDGVLLIRDLYRPSTNNRVEELVEQHAEGADPTQKQLFRASLQAALTPDELRKMITEIGASGLEVVIDTDRHMSLQTVRTVLGRAEAADRPRLSLARPSPRDADDRPSRAEPEPSSQPRRGALLVNARPPRYLRRTGTAQAEALALDRVLGRVERLIDLADPKGARAALVDVPKGPFQDPSFHVRAGDACFDLGKMADAELHYRSALLRDPASADTLHRLGMVYADTGRDREMIEVWIQVRRLDEQSPRAPWAVSEDDFAEIAEDTLGRLPAEVKAKLVNLPLVVTDMPTEGMIRDGVDPRILGMITGVPLSEKGMLDDGTPTLDCVQLYQSNIERFSGSPEQVREEIAKTVVHEVMHYFGLTEEDLERWGLA